MKKTIKKQLKTYICPKCKKTNSTVLEWSTCSVCYEMNLNTGDGKEIDLVAGEFESYSCPSCGEELPSSMNPKIIAVLGI